MNRIAPAKQVRVLRPEIESSWRRSRLAGLDRDSTLDPAIVDIDAASRIMQAAAPVLKELAQQFEGFEVGALLADRSATLVAGCFGTAALKREVDRLGAVPGVTFSETQSGTNAVATPFETRTGMFVAKDEHFLASMSHYFCYGVPILHPLTQRVEGVLDVMTAGGTSPALMKSVIDRAAHDIRRQLIESYDVNVMAIFAAFNTLRRNATDAVVMISDDIVLNNRHSVDILEPEDYVTLRRIALESPGFSGTLAVTLGSGAQAMVKVTDMGDPPATVFQLRRAEQPARVVPRGALPECPTSDLERAVAAARNGTGHVFVEGEAGSGRSWVAHQIAESAAVSYTDACDLLSAGPGAWSVELDRLIAADPPILIIDNVDVLPKAVAQYLARVLRAHEPGRVVLTCTNDPELPAQLRYLQSLCATTVQIPPLRERGAEFDALVGRIVRARVDAPTVRLTLSAIEALAGHSWPGNVSELARVVGDLLGKRSAGDITVHDLPEQFRGAKKTRNLSALQRAEKEAIESALNACRGNKVHAATQLGISRSTLYARIREYGLRG